jgi:hypothetical protein
MPRVLVIKEPEPLSGDSKRAESMRYRLENDRLGGYFVIVNDHRSVDILRAQLTDCGIKDGKIILYAERYFVERQYGYFAHGTFPVRQNVIWQSKLKETTVSSYRDIGWELRCGSDSVIIL